MKISKKPDDSYGTSNGVQSLSAATCKISLFRDDLLLSTASGFLTEDAQSWFLVTALHNFTGRDFFSRNCLSKQLAIPNKFRATYWWNLEGETFVQGAIVADLFRNETPVFLYDCSDEGGDIAVFRIPKSVSSLKFVTMSDTASKNWTAYAGIDVFALGYPSALDVNGTPVWKKLSIASEPSQKVNGKNATLTDGLTYSGMSGCPVIIYQNQGFADDGNYSLGSTLAARVIGVYGGRFDTDADKSGTLGFYWPMETVNAIIAEERQVGDIDGV